MNFRHLLKYCLASLAFASVTSCVTDKLEECPNDYQLKIVFDRNMLFADAFASQVKSVDIKVFDTTTGREVFRHTEQGDALAAEGYRVALPVPPGSYNILCWVGMAEGESFGYADPSAEILENHNVVLNTENGVSAAPLNNLYHGLARNVEFIDNNTIGSLEVQTATVYLTKNTNRVNVILLNLDGSEMKTADFSLAIYSGNGEMAHDNSIDAKRAVEYRPWAITPIVSETSVARAATQSALGAEFSLGRLTSTSASRLEIYRNSDGETIVSVPLERNLLLYKGQFHASMSDDEYLDREDDYNITFILDKNNNWDSAAMIYINNWATLPVQYQEW